METLAYFSGLTRAPLKGARSPLLHYPYTDHFVVQRIGSTSPGSFGCLASMLHSFGEYWLFGLDGTHVRPFHNSECGSTNSVLFLA